MISAVFKVSTAIFFLKENIMKFREARFKAGLTQWDLALRTGISQSKISLIERGFIRPSLRESFLLAGTVRIRPEEIEWSFPSDQPDQEKAR